MNQNDGAGYETGIASDCAEIRERQFKHDFAWEMWRQLPDDAKERLRESRGGD